MTVNRRRVAGGDDTFMTVDHLTVSGSQQEIGRALAAEAATAYGWQPMPVQNRDIGRARRAWFQSHWPEHHERMVGAAQFVGADLAADEVHLDGWAGIPQGSGCSVLWSPPDPATGEHGLAGRNYDFFTTSATELAMLLAGAPVPESLDEAPMSSRPYLITCLPDDGLASSFITMNDLSGCMDGINEAGLMITLLIADAENATGPDEALQPQVGVESTQLLRYVLDRCTTVEEAKAAMLGAKSYDLGPGLHYLVADADGRAFVWERSQHFQEHVIDADGAMCVTNHPLHRHPMGSPLPQDNPETMRTYARSTALQQHAGDDRAMTPERMRAGLDDVRFTADNGDGYPIRTLWRTVFDVTAKTMSVHFYLGDDADGQPRYSPELTVSAVRD
ncbi:acyl-CoA:6-aminopenicillanic acid acyl transferase [Stackebrandtia endophytica]|uniref:Acyl-CoA:6-aminopenicillanic acid acyl transferase n=1 Tax=Stackebrandtia endophytica TaxID=1496996 RepID=A0A543AXD6_9ACTN|nr:C45 family peptidase [Stackebrandtia endophytica]TQL77241.1 acyl-CoA:6-aminopenicillanic acid acyl transferase [Stackebrandtia endophytica]